MDDCDLDVLAARLLAPAYSSSDNAHTTLKPLRTACLFAHLPLLICYQPLPCSTVLLTIVYCVAVQEHKSLVAAPIHTEVHVFSNFSHHSIGNVDLPPVIAVSLPTAA